MNAKLGTYAPRAGLAQLVERQFCKLDVAGSIPATGTTIRAAAFTPA